MSFSKLPLEVRKMIYSLLEPEYEEKSFNIKEIQEANNDDGIDEHEDAYLMRFHHDTRALYLKPYLRQFEAVILRGGVGDYVQFDMYNDDSLGYFLRSGITHFGAYTCDYETGYCDDGAGHFASGKIEVWVKEDGEVCVSGKASCDDASMDHIFRQWWINFKREIKNTVKADPMGLISWDLMECVNTELEGEVEDFRARSEPEEEEDEEMIEEMDESGHSDNENEADDDDDSSSVIAAESSENEEDASCVTSEVEEDEEK